MAMELGATAVSSPSPALPVGEWPELSAPAQLGHNFYVIPIDKLRDLIGTEPSREMSLELLPIFFCQRIPTGGHGAGSP